MFCPECHKVYSNNNVFCVECGTKLVDNSGDIQKSPIERLSSRVKNSSMDSNATADLKIDVLMKQNEEIIKQNKHIILLLERLLD